MSSKCKNISYNYVTVDEFTKLDFKPNKLQPCETGPTHSIKFKIT